MDTVLRGVKHGDSRKGVARKRLERSRPWVVFGTMDAVSQVRSAGGRKMHTAFVARLHLAVFHVYHNVVLPHASLRQPLAAPVPTHGRGSARVWRPCTPAMAAGWTDHVWSLREGRRFRVPPWPQPQMAKRREA